MREYIFNLGIERKYDDVSGDFLQSVREGDIRQVSVIEKILNELDADLATLKAPENTEISYTKLVACPSCHYVCEMEILEATVETWSADEHEKDFDPEDKRDFDLRREVNHDRYLENHS